MNHPFSSAINIIDEKTQNTTPVTILGRNVLLSQQQQQKMLNTLTTSIADSPFGPPLQQPFNFPSPAQKQPFCFPGPAQKQPFCFPGPAQNCVTFTFGRPQQPQFFAQQPSWQCYGHPSDPVQLTLNQLQQSNAANLFGLQQQLSPCNYQLKFHLDGQTSTTDLNASTKEKNSVTDELIRENSSDAITKRKVSFDGEKQGNQQNAEIQAHVCCGCCNCKVKKTKCGRRNKKKKGKIKNGESSSTDQTSTDGDENEEDIR